MGTIKDRNGSHLTEAEDIKKRWQEYTEELYKKDFHDPDNHDGVITHLEPDILECEVKWALGSITMNKATQTPRVLPRLLPSYSCTPSPPLGLALDNHILGVIRHQASVCPQTRQLNGQNTEP